MRTGFQATTEGTRADVEALAKAHGWVLEDPNTYADGDTELLEMWAEDGIVFVSIPEEQTEALYEEGYLEIASFAPGHEASIAVEMP